VPEVQELSPVLEVRDGVRELIKLVFRQSLDRLRGEIAAVPRAAKMIEDMSKINSEPRIVRRGTATLDNGVYCRLGMADYLRQFVLHAFWVHFYVLNTSNHA